MRLKASFSKHRSTLAGALLAGTVILASSRGHISAPHVQGIDKVAHFLVFGLLATLLLRSPLSRGKAWLAILIVSLFGITDEWHQSFVPGRSCDVYDWISDTLGATLAVMLYRHWGLYRRVLEWTPKYRRQALPEASPS